MADYIDREKIYFNAFFDAGDYSQAKRCVYNVPAANVVERSKIDKAIEEIAGYARFHRDKTHNDTERGKYLAYEKCIEILKRNLEE